MMLSWQLRMLIWSKRVGGHFNGIAVHPMQPCVRRRFGTIGNKCVSTAGFDQQGPYGNARCHNARNNPAMTRIFLE